MKQPFVAALVLVTFAAYCIGLLNGKPCSTSQLSVFNEVSGKVNKCLQDSKLGFSMPPNSTLSKSQQAALCKSKACQDMIGAVDDLNIPRCEATFDNKNITLQASLDKFVSSCDTSTPTPSPIKRRKSFESSSSGGSDSYSKKRHEQNAAAPIHVSTDHQLFVLLALVISSVVAMSP